VLEGSRLLYISGEVGVLPDGTVPETIEAQAEAAGAISSQSSPTLGWGSMIS
jgi:enamine deaminase RidA (YjgF/YER057c/UK114 family)